MKEGSASRTADVAAAYRAAEWMRPVDQRVCHDPYARDFLRGIYAMVTRSKQLTKLWIWGAQRIAPGTRGWTIGRHEYIDDHLRTQIDEGIAQLVILGAGYDTRAYRFHELKERIRVFEVDHPSTQKAKMLTIKKIFGAVPQHVTYVPVDFGRERIEERLSERGYDARLKTLFIWEAVNMYLTADAVDETLSLIANNSGAGSSIAFDYVFKSVADGSCRLKAAKKFRKQVERRGDPITFGIEEGCVEEFLSERGFYQVQSCTCEGLKSAYFKGTSRDIDVAPFFGYAHATVKPGV